jgi:hypothetical protein
MGSYNDTMKQLQGTDDVKQDLTCWHHGCPIEGAINTAGTKECVFHHGQKGMYHQHITNSIKKNRDLIDNYNKFLKHEDWGNPAMINWLETNTLLPIKKYEDGTHEPISLYINRYYNWMVAHVLEEATQGL